MSLDGGNFPGSHPADTTYDSVLHAIATQRTSQTFGDFHLHYISDGVAADCNNERGGLIDSENCEMIAQDMWQVWTQ